MNDEDGLQEAIDRNSKDHQAKMALADLLEERGDPRAAGYRALGHLGRSPTPYGHNGISEYGAQQAGVPFNPEVYSYWRTRSNLLTPDHASDELPEDWLHLIRSHPDSLTARHRSDRGEEPFSSRYHPTRRQMDDAAAEAFGRLPPERQAQLMGSPRMYSRPDKTMRFIKTGSTLLDKTMRFIKTGADKYSHHIPHNSHGGKRDGAGRPKMDPKAKKRPVTTWLSPREIKHLKEIGGKDAQDGIRRIVHRSTPAKKSRTPLLPYRYAARRASIIRAGLRLSIRPSPGDAGGS